MGSGKITNIRARLGDDLVNSIEKRLAELVESGSIEGIDTNCDHCELFVTYIAFQVKNWPLAVSE